MPIKRPQAALMVGLSGALALTACSTQLNSDDPAPTISPSITPAAQPSLPADGKWLREYGFQHGPEGFSLPTGLVIAERVDQPNVVTLIVPGEQTESLTAYLEEHLGSMGFAIVARDPSTAASSTLVFQAPGWHGACTRGDSQAALTLRRDQGSFRSPR